MPTHSKKKGFIPWAFVFLGDCYQPFGVYSLVSVRTLNYRLNTKINQSNSHQPSVCVCVCVHAFCFTFFIAYFAAPESHDSILSHFMAALKAVR